MAWSGRGNGESPGRHLVIRHRHRCAPSPKFPRPFWLREAWSGQHNGCTCAKVNKAPPSCTLGLPLGNHVDPKAIFHARRPFLQRRHRRGDARNSAPAPAPWHILADLHHRDRRAARRPRPRRLGGIHAGGAGIALGARGSGTTNVSTVLAPRTPLPEIRRSFLNSLHAPAAACAPGESGSARAARSSQTGRIPTAPSPAPGSRRRGGACC
jgi:hypothetical protein